MHFFLSFNKFLFTSQPLVTIYVSKCPFIHRGMLHFTSVWKDTTAVCKKLISNRNAREEIWFTSTACQQPLKTTDYTHLCPYHSLMWRFLQSGLCHMSNKTTLQSLWPLLIHYSPEIGAFCGSFCQIYFVYLPLIIAWGVLKIAATIYFQQPCECWNWLDFSNYPGGTMYKKNAVGNSL